MTTLNAERYLGLLLGKVVPCLLENDEILTVIFMQDIATSHIATPVKEFLIQTFGKNRLISRGWEFPWPPGIPDLTLTDF